MNAKRMKRSYTVKMTMDEAEKSLSSNFSNLDIEEENSAELPFSTMKENSRVFRRNSTGRRKSGESSPKNERSKHPRPVYHLIYAGIDLFI